jgi:hypothetical protein
MSNELKYHSKIEQYWFEEKYKEFEMELKNYIGYLMRTYCPGFRQSADLYKDFRGNTVADVYCYLKGGHYAKTLKRLTEEGKTLEFTSYLWTQIRGCITIYMNKYNKYRKRVVSFGNNLFEASFIEDYDLTEVNIQNICKVHNIELQDTVQNIVFYLKQGFILKEFKNIYQVKTLLWILAKELKE